MDVLFLHHTKWRVIWQYDLFTNPLINSVCLKSKTTHLNNDHMRFTSSTLEMKGLRWKGSLGLFNQSHLCLKSCWASKQTKAASFGVQWCTVKLRNNGNIAQSHRSHMHVTTGCHLPCLSFPRAQIMPISAVCCLHFASTYGKATTGEDRGLHKGAFWQSHSSIGSVGLSFAGNDTDKDQARSP